MTLKTVSIIKHLINILQQRTFFRNRSDKNLTKTIKSVSDANCQHYLILHYG